MRVAAFTGGHNVPSARFRVRQYVEPLQHFGIELDEVALKTSAYPPAGRLARPVWGMQRLAELSRAIASNRNADVTLLQREMISSFKTLESFTTSPRILDVDDAVHLQRGGGFARKIAQSCDRVIAGNSFLADYYSRWNRDVVILPTAVDSDIYVPAEKKSDQQVLVIGWIGTSANFPFLLEIEAALGQFLSATPGAHLKIISNMSPNFQQIDPTRWSFSAWSEANEVADIQSMDIGIMPLADNEWARGKCSFKMLQYMACGLPVVVSPVGMNADVLQQGDLGVAAASNNDWVDGLQMLAQSATRRAEMGQAGRQVIDRHYAVKALAPQLARHLGSNRGAYT